MCEQLQSIQLFLRDIDWTLIIQGGIGVWMAIIATVALRTWKHQTKAKKQIDFIDDLTDTIHAFILSMSAPIEYIKYAKIGINCHADYHGEPDNIKNPEAVAFIKKEGKSTRLEIKKCLETTRPILSKMRTLEAKGQIFGIEDYTKCQIACRMLGQSYNQIEAFSYVIGNPNLNWENPEVQKTLDSVLSIDPENIRSNLDEQNSQFLLFAKQVYGKILK